MTLLLTYTSGLHTDFDDRVHMFALIVYVCLQHVYVC